MSEISDIEQHHLDNPPVCSGCGRKMVPQWDARMQRISGFKWGCKCLPQGMQLMIV